MFLIYYYEISLTLRSVFVKNVFTFCPVTGIKALVTLISNYYTQLM